MCYSKVLLVTVDRFGAKSRVATVDHASWAVLSKFKSRLRNVA